MSKTAANETALVEPLLKDLLAIPSTSDVLAGLDFRGHATTGTLESDAVEGVGEPATNREIVSAAAAAAFTGPTMCLLEMDSPDRLDEVLWLRRRAMPRLSTRRRQA